MVQTSVCKRNPIKKIPSQHTDLTYHPFTGEIYKDGRLYAKIRKNIYTQKRKKILKYAHWNRSIINYFHPVKFVFYSTQQRFSISYDKLVQFGKVNSSNKDLIDIEIKNMTKEK